MFYTISGNSTSFFITATHTQKPKSDTSFLGTFAELWKAIISFVMSCPSVCLSTWKNSAPTGCIYMKFDYWSIFKKTWRENSGVIKKSDKSNGYFT
jgi:hypothetical protein